jgi:hypothetical protein
MMRQPSDALRRLAISVFFGVLVILAVQTVVGGFRLDAFGVRLSNNSFVRPVVVLLLITAFLFRPSMRAAVVGDLKKADALLERVSPVIAGVAALAALTVGLLWGTRAAGGSDSYCYIGQAVEFAQGRTRLLEPLRERVSVPRADLVFAPVGFIPGAHGGAVPMCAPGLSLLMAPAWKIGGDPLLHAVVPALGALAVWLTFVLARNLQDRTTGASAAGLVCASPIFLYQVVQPMSDVPAAAFWLATFAAVMRKHAGHELAGGFLASMALLIRPNLAPALLPVCALVALVSRVRGTLYFLAGLAPGCALLLWLNDARYGSAFRTGYGDTHDLFSFSHALPNASRYLEWTLASHTPFILLAFAAPLAMQLRRIPFDSGQRAFVWSALAFALVVFVSYLPYSIFDAWWYTRFLLPALPFALILASFTLVALASKARLRSVVIVPILTGLLAWSVSYARSHEAFALKDLERRYISAGTYVGQTLPANAIVMTIQESGAVRHYGGRPAALWDAIAPDALDETIAHFQSVGLHPYLLLEDGELAGFRERFQGERFGALDWRPLAKITERVTVWLFDPVER